MAMYLCSGGKSGDDILANFDLTSSLVDSVNGFTGTKSSAVTLSSAGAKIGDNSSIIKFPQLQGLVLANIFTFEFTFGDFDNKNLSGDRQFMMWQSSNAYGLYWRGTQSCWSVKHNGTWYDEPSLNNANYFANKNVKFKWSMDGTFKIYVNNELVYNKTIGLMSGNVNQFSIGSSFNCAYIFYVKALKVYK